MGSRNDYYRVLHVSDDAPLEVIRSSYRTLMKTLGAHPDLGGDEAGARALNEAWEVLSDPAERKRYDARRALVDEPSPPKASSRTTSSPARESENRDAESHASASPPSERRATTRLKRNEPITWAIGEGRSQASTVRDLSPQGFTI